MPKGIVKFFNESKGWGFITGDDDRDIFIHKSGVINSKTLKDGIPVTFAVEQGPRGKFAFNVQLVSS